MVLLSFDGYLRTNFQIVDKESIDHVEQWLSRGIWHTKKYLQEPPILIPHVPGRPLIMYLTGLDESMGCVMGQHDDTGKKEHVIYYLSKKFTECETGYSVLEKTWCALPWVARCMGQYMVCHTTLLISKNGSNKVYIWEACCHRKNSRWKMLLTEYDIQYVTQKLY